MRSNLQRKKLIQGISMNCSEHELPRMQTAAFFATPHVQFMVQCLTIRYT